MSVSARLREGGVGFAASRHRNFRHLTPTLSASRGGEREARQIDSSFLTNFAMTCYNHIMIIVDSVGARVIAKARLRRIHAAVLRCYAAVLALRSRCFFAHSGAANRGFLRLS